MSTDKTTAPPTRARLGLVVFSESWYAHGPHKQTLAVGDDDLIDLTVISDDNESLFGEVSVYVGGGGRTLRLELHEDGTEVLATYPEILTLVGSMNGRDGLLKGLGELGAIDLTQRVDPNAPKAAPATDPEAARLYLLAVEEERDGLKARAEELERLTTNLRLELGSVYADVKRLREHLARVGAVLREVDEEDGATRPPPKARETPWNEVPATELERIAFEELGVRSLRERGRDHLDFHHLGVLNIRDALAAAYHLGRKSS